MYLYIYKIRKLNFIPLRYYDDSGKSGKSVGMISPENTEIPEFVHRWVHFNKCIFRWECFRGFFPI